MQPEIDEKMLRALDKNYGQADRVEHCPALRTLSKAHCAPFAISRLGNTDTPAASPHYTQSASWGQRGCSLIEDVVSRVIGTLL
jgi:hypothetical protein